jgi:hypothetical protein
MRCALLLRAVLAAVLMAFGLVAIAPGAQAAPGDSLGTDFWVSFPTNYQGTQGLQLFVTGPTATTGSVEIPGLSYSQQFTVTPGTATKLVVPTSAELALGDGVEQKGIHVTTADEVSVYGLNRVQGSTDAFLALPTDVLGSEYLVLSYAGLGGGFPEQRGSQFSVAATQDGTVLTITPSVAIGSRAAGQPYQVTMDAGDAYQLHSLSQADLTGTIVASNHPVGVFAGSRCSNVPDFVNYCDHLVEQLTPPSTWGKKFVTQPLATRTQGDVFRVLAGTDATHVTINGSQVATLDRGNVFETTLAAASTITTDQPVLVGQYSQSTEVDGVTSDPFVMLIPPYEQFLSAYTVTTPDEQFGFTNYVNVVAPTTDVGLVKADGAVIPATSFQPIPGSTFSGAQLAVSSGSHTYEGPNPFGVYVYGFGTNDSYGYPGGMQLAPLATVTAVTMSPATGSAFLGDEGCTTATVTDQDGNPVPNVRVDFTVAGANTTSASLTAGANGTAEYCYQGSAAGSDTVTAAVGTVTGTAALEWVSPDTTAPSLTGTPTTEPNAAGWYSGDVLVRWTATDEEGGSGIDPATVPADSSITGEGEGLTASASVSDRAGNTTTASSPAVNIDRTAPTISFAGNAGHYALDQTVVITCTAADALSGIDTATCPSVSGPAYDYLGENTLTATATDHAGNTAVTSTRFTVAVTADSLCDLTRQLVTTPNDAKAFCVKLAHGQVGAYQNAVRAKSGKSVTPENARLLIELSTTL